MHILWNCYTTLDKKETFFVGKFQVLYLDFMIIVSWFSMLQF
jgi:hypothetical protein